MPTVRELESRGLAQLPAELATKHAAITGIEPGVEPQPWHKFAAFMQASGQTTQAICEMLEVSRGELFELECTSYYRDLKREAYILHAKDLQEMIALQGFEAFSTMIELMHVSEDDRVRLSAAKEILDRATGRPNERPQASPKALSAFKDPQAEMKALRSELKTIEAREAKEHPKAS